MQTDNHARRILLGISGGIAAYKAPSLVRNLRVKGAEVVPVLTRNASKFVTETALQAVAGHRPRTDLWDAEAEASMGHIELARWADAVLIAPATADLVARMAHGIADDLLTTLCLATAAPVFVAPAMNVKMWEHAATQRNLERLRADGVTVLGPDDGEQACGEFGPGRMMAPEEIAETVSAAVGTPRVLAGTKVLVTAGPTREFLDPVRFISNRSSGRQGFAFAEAARNAGAEVTLVAGPVHLATPTGIERVDVVSAQEMKDAVTERAAGADIFVSVAAVADYR
ncbi:MAG: bifunctional phosphopantothenoylcysteine decarboxylase/phosphopantothenate--cysteine ligase CoaBC, partial [Gammaproteobacteria bacterium]|nr:bifunctional phosphopantothenoylcysteine decarboxylase/phosphopantothenate--cysteine ligase CoaBC [Gammaproteobacteria bacterium]